MRAVQYAAYGALPTLVDIAPPRCAPDGVVINVQATGLCRSDWHAWRGHEVVALPHVPGHEFAGVVAAVGADVHDFSPGDRVTVPFVLGCGLCDSCRRGDAQVCSDQRQPGFTGPGSFAEQVAVERADFNLVALPDALSFVSAAVLGCRFATAFRALTVHGAVAPGQWVAVFGCGGVGLSTVMIARALGAHVVALDQSSTARARAADLGAVAVDPAGGVDVVSEVREASDGGVHVCVDAVGSAAIAISAVRTLRQRGRHVQVGLLHGADATPALPMAEVIAGELEIHGSHGMAARDYPAMLELVASGRLRPDQLVGRVITLDGAPAALASMDEAGADGITVIQP